MVDRYNQDSPRKLHDCHTAVSLHRAAYCHIAVHLAATLADSDRPLAFAAVVAVAADNWALSYPDSRDFDPGVTFAPAGVQESTVAADVPASWVLGGDSGATVPAFLDVDRASPRAAV